MNQLNFEKGYKWSHSDGDSNTFFLGRRHSLQMANVSLTGSSCNSCLLYDEERGPPIRA